MQASGFVKGRPNALYVLDFGLFKVHSNGRVIGICGYLVQTDQGENILIDSGFPQKYNRDPAAATQEDRLYEFGEVLECRPEHSVHAQLSKLGLSADDINLYICSHTHIDHIGGLGDFPNAPILISAAERALDAPLYWGQMRPVDWPEATYLQIEADTQIGPGFDVLMAPGHAPGQIAMMLELPETGAVLLTSDAISRPAEIDEKFAGSWDEEAALASALRLMEMSEARIAFVIYGHAPDQWGTLHKAPEAYR